LPRTDRSKQVGVPDRNGRRCSISEWIAIFTGVGDGRLPSAIRILLLLGFGPQFNESPDCFGTGGKVDLSAAPVVYHSQKLLRDPHLERTILSDVFAWSPTRPRIIICHLCTFVLTVNLSRATQHAGRWQAGNSPPALTRATEMSHGPG
jgi:hypothetical protein